MKFIVCFCADRQIIESPGSNCKFKAPHSNYSLEDWKKLSHDEIVEVQCIYQGQSHDAVLLQVIPNDIEDTTSIVKRLRGIQWEKKKSAISMVSACKTRVLQGERSKFSAVIQTSADESDFCMSNSMPSCITTVRNHKHCARKISKSHTENSVSDFHDSLLKPPTPPTIQVSPRTSLINTPSQSSSFAEESPEITLNDGILHILNEINERQARMEKEIRDIRQSVTNPDGGRPEHIFAEGSGVSCFRPAETDMELHELLVSPKKKEIISKLATVRRLTLSATVYHMLLALAKPNVWANYSRDGKRGKKKATNLGVLDVIVLALAKQLKKDEFQLVPKVSKKLGEALKRMPSTCKSMTKKSQQELQEATTESATSASETSINESD